MAMQVHEMALSIIEALAPLLPLIQRQDRALAVQLRTAASSMVLNIAESEYSDPGNRRARLFTAAGSTNESRSAVRVAISWGYIRAERAADVSRDSTGSWPSCGSSRTAPEPCVVRASVTARK